MNTKNNLLIILSWMFFISCQSDSSKAYVPESNGNIKDQFLLWCKTSKDLDGGDITNWEQLDGSYNSNPNNEIWISSKDLSDNKPYKPTGSFINSNYILNITRADS